MSFKVTTESLWSDLQKVRETAPLVHNITNYVVMNSTANALLAVGASPVMAHAQEEVEEMAAIAAALVINIGTLSPDWITAMQLAMKTAVNKGIPVVFDPVGSGATSFRTRTCRELLSTGANIIRGNASEIMSLVDASIQTKGVDSASDVSLAEQAALDLAKHYDNVVVVSGATDLITDGNNKAYIPHGHPMMAKVTGLGCTATAMVGTFSAINRDNFVAAAHAMALMGICGEIAVKKAQGPASLQLHLIDTFYTIDQENIAAYLQG
ncbi:hydroxyethylthiazole kinase [Desulfuromusa kysingii]|uniref:Hydroxyethylthiazole kinase n=1 Tax=Desulfuromusa kysingii TaxID=37625 RepID=A0A1H4AX61_9BACT|nr:hydroxyethylthiazole kinase [Desulfuromusa kysingii]SEA40445.1 hydroxyethylthiazole kinase [Desulfuromusa kysingii]